MGAFAGLARVLALYDVEITKRRVLANVVGGAVVAIICGGLYAFFFPDKTANVLPIAAIAAAAGAVGFPWITSFIRERVEKHVETLDKRINRQVNVDQRLDESHKSESDDSIGTKKSLIDSQEFSEEEIKQMIEGARQRREKAAHELDITDESRK